MLTATDPDPGRRSGHASLLAAHNTAAWKLAIGRALGFFVRDEPDCVVVDAGRRHPAHNVIVPRRPGISLERLQGLVRAFPAAPGRMVLQDCWSATSPLPGAEMILDAPVLFRDPTVDGRERVPWVHEVRDDDDLRRFERTLVDAFPMPQLQPWIPGGLWDPPVLAITGHHLYIATLGGRVAGTSVAFDDGSSIGVYWVAVVPDLRGRGIGRALTEAAARSGPHPAVLSSTALGLPLYRSMGFRPRGRVQWWAMLRSDS